jgi:Raf kinase inhibitor-like YbhB/YbcL family protein
MAATELCQQANRPSIQGLSLQRKEAEMTDQAHPEHGHQPFHHKAQPPEPPQHSGEAISIQKVKPRRDDGIVVTSPGLDAQGRIDPRYSAAENGGSPPLAWDAVKDAEAYALIVEDPDAPRDRPFVHWMIWNISGPARGLEANLPGEVHLVLPQPAVQGKNDTGAVGWYGPKPPPGHGVHHYYFQLFALDGRLGLDPATTDVRILVDALKGRTLVSGQLVGTFETPGGAAGTA